MLMVGTILGPGTIFLMIVGSTSAAFHVGNTPSFIWNLVPILIFMILCMTVESKTQVGVFQQRPSSVERSSSLLSFRYWWRR